MTYLTRPVFEFDANWAEHPAKSFDYDLREVMLGFGVEYFNRLQTHVVQGHAFEVLLQDADELLAFDAFTAALKGPLAGFWLPSPFLTMEVVGAVSATQFDITDQGLRDTLENQPDIYLWIARPGIAARPCKIAAVALQSPGVERVTLTAALGTPVTAADVVSRLLYVRLAGDEEKGEFFGEGEQRREVRVVELPHEYEAFETGASPLFLYHFFCDPPLNKHWRYTSFAANIVSGNQLFSTFPMTHGALNHGGRLDQQTLEIEAKFDPQHAFALFLPFPLSKPMQVEVLKTTLADPNTTELIFSGFVRVPGDQGDKIVADSVSYWANLMTRKFPPQLIQPEDDGDIFDEAVGGVPRWKFECPARVIGTDAEAQPPTLTLELTRPESLQAANWQSEDWFAGGYVTLGVGMSYRVRTILASSFADDELTLVLNAPLEVTAEEFALVIPGYDGSFAQRRDKFKAADSFGGFLDIPQRNLSLQANTGIVSQGGKK